MKLKNTVIIHYNNFLDVRDPNMTLIRNYRVALSEHAQVDLKARTSSAETARDNVQQY